MPKPLPRFLIIILVALLLIAAIFAAGQAVTFAWLSNFPERAGQIESLKIKFWSYAVLSGAFFAIDGALLVYLSRQLRKRRQDIENHTS